MSQRTIINKNAISKAILLLSMFIVSISAVSAAELGMNYYHETMMNQGTNGNTYIPRTLEQVDQDMKDIKQYTSYIKLYANPMIPKNIEWVLDVAKVAKANDMHVVVAMNTEDRVVDKWVFLDYMHYTLSACKKFSGIADEFLVGNELSLHTDESRRQVRVWAEHLINNCEFDGPVSYEAFWWTRETWYGYPNQIYFNMYENTDYFWGNIVEMDEHFGSNAIIGEFGDLNRGRQYEDVKRRWELIQTIDTPRAYLFTWREPSDDGFGVINNDGTHRSVMELFMAAPSNDSNNDIEPVPVQNNTSPPVNLNESDEINYIINSSDNFDYVNVDFSMIIPESALQKCITVSWGSESMKLCDKDVRYEIYSGAKDFSSPVESLACVGGFTGFASYAK